MSTFSPFRAALVAVALFTTVASSSASEEGTGLLAAYGAGRDVAAADQMRIDATVDFDWGNGSPGGSIGFDHFCAEWVGILEAPVSGRYLFQTTSDDGVMLWVDDVLVIARWTDHPPTVDSGSMDLQAGATHRIRMRFYENGGGAVARLAWQPPGQDLAIIPQRFLYPIPQTAALFPAGTGAGLSASYFSRYDFTGTADDRLDPGVSVDAQTRVPIDEDPSRLREMSAIWSGELEAPIDGDYVLSLASSGAALMWLDDQLVIDAWSWHAASAGNVRLPLTAGSRHRIKIRYSAHAVVPWCSLWWSAPGIPPQIIPASRLFPQRDLPASLSTTATETSLVSPAWIEGDAGGSGTVVSATAGDAPLTVVRHAGSSWYLASRAAGPVGVDLDPAAPTRISVQARQGEVVRDVVRDVRWQALMVDEPPYGVDRLTIRVGDRIRVGLSATDGDARIVVDGAAIDAWQPGSAVPLSWSQPGPHHVRGLAGARDLGGVLVRVVDADLSDPIACQVGFTRGKDLATPGDDDGSIVFISPDDLLMVATSARAPGAASLALTPVASGHPILQARIGNRGPLVAEREIDEFTLDCTADKTLAVIEQLPDGTMRGEAYLRMWPLVPHLDVAFWTFVAGVTFGDSSTFFWTGTDAFEPLADGSGSLRFELIRAPNVPHGFCHDHVVYQSGVKISN